jgi:hypothetical protein
LTVLDGHWRAIGEKRTLMMPVSTRSENGKPLLSTHKFVVFLVIRNIPGRENLPPEEAGHLNSNSRLMASKDGMKFVIDVLISRPASVYTLITCF